MRHPAALALLLLALVATPLAAATQCSPPSSGPVLSIVATLPDYAYLASRIGGDRVEVEHIVRGDQDAHFIRPKPSFVAMLKRADMLVATGLDLELWLPTVVDQSGNLGVRSGRPGYVATSREVQLLEVPTTLSRMEGGLHVYGNPHVTVRPAQAEDCRPQHHHRARQERPGREGAHELNEDSGGDRPAPVRGGAPRASRGAARSMAEQGTLSPSSTKHRSAARRSSTRWGLDQADAPASLQANRHLPQELGVLPDAV